jgi:hypothetical protein
MERQINLQARKHMRSKPEHFLALIILIALFVLTGNAFGYGDYGNNVNALCAPKTPYTGNCNLCHSGAESNPTAAKSDES